MKTILYLSCVLCLLAFSTTPARAVAAGSPLTIELRDGSRVMGKGLDETLAFHSATAGDVKLAWSGIRAIEFTGTNTDTAKLTATNGSLQLVQFAAATVKVETSLGKNDLLVNLIRSVKVTAPEPTVAVGVVVKENSLGMKFVAVPGTKVLFCIWPVRVKDFAAYAKANDDKMGSWENPTYRDVAVTPSEDCPVVMVSWKEANAFCTWLTKTERAAGKIASNQKYRLPREREWDVAVGNKTLPGEVTSKPAMEVGNYADATAKKSFSDFQVVEGYDDGFATTSPVGSFKPNKFGLYDMSGNVVQWCEDRHEKHRFNQVLRGSSWQEGAPEKIQLSHRTEHMPTSRANEIGFRVVLGDNSVETAPQVR